MMTVEILLIGSFIGMTLLAYMIAINAHGPTRLGLSYLIATAMLAGTVWVTVQYVNTNQDSRQVAELEQLNTQKKLAEDRLRSQEQALQQHRIRLTFATQLTALITKGSELAAILSSVELQDKSLDLDGLIGRAAARSKDARDLKNEVEQVQSTDTSFIEPLASITDGVQLVGEAAYYYKTYYYSEDPEQEQLRERIMRQKARAAREKFQAATTVLTSLAQP
jgi:hypothetical protein